MNPRRPVRLQMHVAGVQLLVTPITVATSNAILRLVYRAHRVTPPGTLPKIRRKTKRNRMAV